jgi:hypothetical protein
LADRHVSEPAGNGIGSGPGAMGPRRWREEATCLPW